MRFDLNEPCVDCPFRHPSATTATNQELRESLEEHEKKGIRYPCHRSMADGEYAQACPGADYYLFNGKRYNTSKKKKKLDRQAFLCQVNL